MQVNKNHSYPSRRVQTKAPVTASAAAEASTLRSTHHQRKVAKKARVNTRFEQLRSYVQDRQIKTCMMQSREARKCSSTCHWDRFYVWSTLTAAPFSKPSKQVKFTLLSRSKILSGRLTLHLKYILSIQIPWKSISLRRRGRAEMSGPSATLRRQDRRDNNALLCSLTLFTHARSVDVHVRRKHSRYTDWLRYYLA
jgi:hypothetical protein